MIIALRIEKLIFSAEAAEATEAAEAAVNSLLKINNSITNTNYSNNLTSASFRSSNEYKNNLLKYNKAFPKEKCSFEFFIPEKKKKYTSLMFKTTSASDIKQISVTSSNTTKNNPETFTKVKLRIRSSIKVPYTSRSQLCSFSDVSTDKTFYHRKF